jgi:hypothetical protein
VTILAALPSACAREQPPAVEVTYADVCSQPEGTVVTLQGYFRLPDTMKTYTRLRRTSYRMFFAGSITQDNPPFISITVAGTSSGGAKNQISTMPDNYTYKHLRIFLNDGTAVGPNAYLKITGKLSLLDIGCSVAVSKIEPGQA